MRATSRWFVVLVASFGLSSSVVLAEPAVPPFCQAVMNVKPNGKLGEVIRKEAVESSVPGAQAWRIAYISTDFNDKRTISTGLAVAPKRKAPAGGGPIIS